MRITKEKLIMVGEKISLDSTLARAVSGRLLCLKE